MVAVVIPAAGQGTRLGGLPKQLRRLGDTPMLLKTARAFDQHPAVSSLVVVGRSDAFPFINEILLPLEKPWQIVTGGRTRRESVEAGVKALNESVEIVLIHDAARPFISERIITDVIESVKIHGAAAAALRVTDTVRYGEKGHFTNTVSRKGLYAMQTPQGFKYRLLRNAFCQAGMSADITDDVALMNHIGQEVHIIQGDHSNIKITTQSDWEWAKRMGQTEQVDS